MRLATPAKRVGESAALSRTSDRPHGIRTIRIADQGLDVAPVADDLRLLGSCRLDFIIDFSSPPSSEDDIERRHPGTPGNLATIIFVIGQIGSWMCAKLYKTFVRDDWAIGIIERSIEEVCREGIGEVRWYGTGDPHTYIADPIPLPGAGDRTFLAEHFDYS